MKFAIIIRGPAGVGKSSISNKLKEEIPNLIHIDIDKFKHIISKESNTTRSKIAQDVGIFFIKQLIKNKYNIIVDEIFREKYYYQMIRVLEKNNYSVIKIFLCASTKNLIKRDKKRLKNKGKEIIIKLEKEIRPLNGDIIIDTNNKSVRQIINQILKILSFNKLLGPSQYKI
ncbi:MAG: zeta toxin family protein [archaeon]